ncbi:MAG: hypothetical protein AABN33_19020 [Acidobacteriota bacterium]
MRQQKAAQTRPVLEELCFLFMQTGLLRLRGLVGHSGIIVTIAAYARGKENSQVQLTISTKE